MASEAFKAVGVAKAFGDSQALTSCSLSAYPGEVHAIVGENGSGKSTLSKIVAGILSADHGTVEVLGGRPPRSPYAARRAGIELVLQEILVVEGASVLDNLFLGHDGFLRPCASRKRKADIGSGLLKRLAGESYDLSVPIESLPLSARQWVVIARALVKDPRVLILDEATAALDAVGSARLYQEARRLAAAGTCVVTVTHRIEELKGFADRATVLRDGASVATLARAEITESRLLDAMSGGLFAGGPAQRPLRTVPQAARLTTRGLRLRPGADGIDLSVGEGEILGVAALEGHGGPELVEAVAGISRPVAGTIEIAGKRSGARIRSQADAAAAGVGYVSGDRKREGIFPNLSVLDNFGVALYRTTRTAALIDMKAVRRKLAQETARLSLKSPGERAPIGALSGGNQQKVVIGRSLAQSPSVLALNDPTRGVDIPTKRDIYQLLSDLSGRGVTVVFFSSEVEELSEVCHRVAVLRSGSLFAVLRDGEMSADSILAAMFGQAEHSRAAVPPTEV